MVKIINSIKVITQYPIFPKWYVSVRCLNSSSSWLLLTIRNSMHKCTFTKWVGTLKNHKTRLKCEWDISITIYLNMDLSRSRLLIYSANHVRIGFFSTNSRIYWSISGMIVLLLAFMKSIIVIYGHIWFCTLCIILTNTLIPFTVNVFIAGFSFGVYR